MQEFSTFTNPDSMMATLQQRLPGISQGSMKITGCRLLHARYKTFIKPESKVRSSFSAAYELGIRNESSGAFHSQIIYAKAFLGGRNRHEFLKANRQMLYPTPIGVPMVHLEDLGVIIWTFPNDPGLHQLGEIIHPERVKKRIPSCCCVQTRRGTFEVIIGIVNYRPEIRCTARYHIFQSYAGSIRNSHLYGKTYADQSGKKVFHRLKHLSKAGGSTNPGFPLPRLLGYDEDTRTVWQEELPGIPVSSLINLSNHNDLMDQAALRLQFLHRSDPGKMVVDDRITIEDSLNEITRKAVKLIDAFPALKTELDYLVNRLRREASGLRPMPPQVIHGDFHIRQIIIANGSVALFDYDELCLGDPAQDLANFIADLHTQDFSAQLREAVGNSLIERYQHHSGIRINTTLLNWHLRIQLLTRAYRAFLQQKSDLENRVRYFIDLATKL